MSTVFTKKITVIGRTQTMLLITMQLNKKSLTKRTRITTGLEF